jgi:AAA-like domain/PD-(D/E)XK nuclease superfamily
MEKTFNITGNCRPAKHYMADVSDKLAKILNMIDRGEYFIINRPRQYGKTTMLYSIERLLMQRGTYIVLSISFEGIGDEIFEAESKFSPGFIRLLEEQAEIFNPDLAEIIHEHEQKVNSLESLSKALTQILRKTEKAVVLLIDEVDKSSNNQLFISFLAILRNKFLAQDKIKTFHSVVLAGVHDVKSLKLKLRPEDEAKYNSPWNIASDFNVDMNLQPFEIKPMLDEYAADKGVKMDTQLIAEQLFYYTSGYPFLVSKLCKMLDEDIIKNGEWTAEDVEFAVKKLINEENTNFDNLIKNLENNQELYDAVYEVAIASEFVPFTVHSPIINLGRLHGIFVAGNGSGRVAIHNRIYVEVIANYMIDKMRRAKLANRSDLGSGYKNADNTLNMEAVLLGFQTFMKKEYSKNDRDFLEKNGRLVFLAFIKPIINGSGYDFKETQISEEKRLDLVITYLHQKFVAELKLWYGQKAHEKGLAQLTDYLDRQSLSEGYLLVFDHSEVKKWKSEWIESQGKKIFMVWV